MSDKHHRFTVSVAKDATWTPGLRRFFGNKGDRFIFLTLMKLLAGPAGPVSFIGDRLIFLKLVFRSNRFSVRR